MDNSDYGVCIFCLIFCHDNGHPSSKIQPSYSLRQGDPIFPYFYIVCAEASSILLDVAKAYGNIKGLKVARGSPTLTHLFFADDSLHFCRVSLTNWQAIQWLLHVYGTISGQCLNR